MRATAALTLASVLLVAGCAQPGDQQVRQPPGGGNDGSGRAALGDVEPEQPVVIGFMTLCVQGADEGRVTSVDALGDGSIEVTGFTVMDEANVGAAASSLADLGVDIRDTVDSPCSASGAAGYSEMLVEVVRHTKASAEVDGFTVHWVAGTSRGELKIPFPNWLCAPGDHTGSATCLPDL